MVVLRFVDSMCLHLYNMQCLLVGDHLLSGDFGPYVIIYINVCCYNCCHGNADKEFWTLWDQSSRLRIEDEVAI
jgi:hypothetical protein